MATYYKHRLGDILLAAGLISQDQLEWALEQQKQGHKRVGEVLVDAGYVSDDDIAEARSLQLDMPFVHLSPTEIDPHCVKSIPEKVARDYGVVPISQWNDRIVAAMINPMDVEAIDTVRRYTHKRVEPVLASEHRITQLLDITYGTGGTTALIESMEEAIGESEVEQENIVSDDDDPESLKRQSDQAPIIKTVNLIIQEAVKRRASDIHFEPRQKYVSIRYRIDGVLQETRNVPKALQAAIISRIKIMAELDIAEKRIPQDGRIAIRVEGRTVDIRVSTLPIQYGERVVMRILDKTSSLKTLDDLGFSEKDRKTFETIITKPYGIVLVTGPTGSGKTTTLYSALNFLKSSDTNIMTCEDPIEYELDGINQSAINVKAGLTFATQLRAILRQDPDIVLVGEVRDVETAEIAFQAALTGHLVLTTLHCNNAPSAVTRLIDMGVEPFLISSSVIGIVAQRLVRLNCKYCSTEYEATEDEIIAFGLDTLNRVPKLSRGIGCSRCGQTGYTGRIGVYEVMTVNQSIRREILRNPSFDDINKLAVEAGMTSMRQDAIAKMLDGLTTPDEVKRRVFVDG